MHRLKKGCNSSATVISKKEVSRNRMILIGTPGEPYEIIGEKIK